MTSIYMTCSGQAQTTEVPLSETKNPTAELPRLGRSVTRPLSRAHFSRPRHVRTDREASRGKCFTVLLALGVDVK
ncbi:unnamed protein product [Arctia plantaginis]|uniref:Uncharacterized protein n=1 Tax=Arctia plantaginis TaxID=874455 RepID=A0A8S1B7I6_ARCPL|nr:unnamed protein product [Arctia plantaginis]